MPLDDVVSTEATWHGVVALLEEALPQGMCPTYDAAYADVRPIMTLGDELWLESEHEVTEDQRELLGAAVRAVTDRRFKLVVVPPAQPVVVSLSRARTTMQPRAPRRGTTRARRSRRTRHTARRARSPGSAGDDPSEEPDRHLDGRASALLDLGRLLLEEAA